MGAVLYYGFCLVATVAILSGLSQYVIWPWAQWSTRIFGTWDLLVIGIVFVIAYPFIMRTERRIALERGKPAPLHLWQRHPGAPPLGMAQKIGATIIGLLIFVGIVATLIHPV